MKEVIKIGRSVLEEIKSHSREDFPNEVCGILPSISGEGVTRVLEYRRVKNDNPGPMSFLMNGKEHMKVLKESRARSCNEFVIVHSHPTGPSRLSSTDKSMMYDDRGLWFLISHVNEDEPTMQCFRVGCGGIPCDYVEIIIDENN